MQKGTHPSKISQSLARGGGMSFFPVKHEKFPLSYIQDAKNFSAVKSLNSGEAVASPASPVPPPLFTFLVNGHFLAYYGMPYYDVRLYL